MWNPHRLWLLLKALMSLLDSQRSFALLSFSLIMVSSGPGDSGSRSETSRHFLVMKDLLWLDLLSVTALSGVDGPVLHPLVMISVSIYTALDTNICRTYKYICDLFSLMVFYNMLLFFPPFLFWSTFEEISLFSMDYLHWDLWFCFQIVRLSSFRLCIFSLCHLVD